MRHIKCVQYFPQSSLCQFARAQTRKYQYLAKIQNLPLLKSVDGKCKSLTTLTTSRDRKWASGYKYAPSEERVQFALAYQNWLRQNGETGDYKDSYHLVSYTDRQAWAMQWWAKQDPNFAPISSLEAKADWAHDALVDAGNSIHLAGQQVGKLSGDIITKDEVELTAVDTKSDKESDKK
jgi:hypothetical protein